MLKVEKRKTSDKIHGCSEGEAGVTQEHAKDK